MRLIKRNKWTQYAIGLVLGLFVLGLLPSNEDMKPQQAYAACGCTGCVPGDVPAAKIILMLAHAANKAAYAVYLAGQMSQHRSWLTGTFFEQEVAPALKLFTEQMSVVAMQQALIVGTFFDAKHQLETQRVFQELEVQAHKDYQPSEDFCWFGTNVRSMAASEQRGRYNALALSQQQMSRHLGTANTAGAGSAGYDQSTRWAAFTTKYCDPQDNNWFAEEGDKTGLVLACGETGGGTTKRINADIDYTRMIDAPRTLDVSYSNFPDSGTLVQPSKDAEDIFALSKNLYGHKTLSRAATRSLLANQDAQNLYLALRSVAAKRSVAENSFNAIVGLKSEGSSDRNGNEPQTREFLASVMKELGVPDAEVFSIIGERPSYYAQLEILAKKIYQNPDFFANLYDKPANIQRKGVALKAIELMLDRAIYESQIRQEMSMSVLLSSRLRPDFKRVTRDLGNVEAD